MNDTLDRIYLEDAKLTFDKGAFEAYEFFVKDHLMSTRAVFKNSGGTASLVSEHHTYPFGYAFEGDFTTDNKVKRLYNFKERVGDFGLGWNDFGARYYLGGDIPRFLGVDPISDNFPNLSGYNYASNKPVNSIDLHGLQAVLSITQLGVNSKGENFKIRSQEINRPTAGNANNLFSVNSNTQKYGTRGRLDIVENVDTGDRSESFTTSVSDDVLNLVDAAVDFIGSSEGEIQKDGGLAGSAENGQGQTNLINTAADNIELDEFTGGAGPKHPVGQVGAIVRAGVKVGTAVNKEEFGKIKEKVDATDTDTTSDVNYGSYRQVTTTTNENENN